MTKSNTIYNISIDIGTGSTGWSVTDENYSLLKYKGNNMWGVRLFEEGQTAAKRRIARSTRRRIDRRKERIVLLKELLAPMILKEDSNFFMRLEKGYQTRNDKGYDYNIFNEKSFNDITYYKEFKTIYHLRNYLCNNKEKVDPRLIYLALHHIVKYRGNFLYEGQKFEISNSSVAESDFEMALQGLVEEHELNLDVTQELIKKVLKMLSNNKVRKALRKDTCLIEFLGRDDDSKNMIKEVLNLLLGYESNLTKLFPSSNIQKDDADYKTNFSNPKYDEDIDFIESTLSDKFEIIDSLHRVYSFLLLQDVMDSKNTISEAMIEKYNSHHRDLKELKTFVKKHYSILVYNAIFRDKNAKGNYYSYINEPKDTPKKEFYIFLKKQLMLNEAATNTTIFNNIIEKIEMDNYLQKQNSTDNGAIPFQLHEMELVRILENQGVFYDDIATNKDKIISLFRFRVPYYVGPLNKNSNFAWFKRKEEGIIKPWNFDDKIDKVESAEMFIRKMTNTCSYLRKESVIAKKSLLYTRYEVLNELNKIRINSKILTVETKKEILDEVFMQKKKVKSNDIKDFYIRKQYCNSFDEIKIEGFQKKDEFASSLEPWIDFKNIYGEDFESHYDEIEKIIEWISVYEDKRILVVRIKREYPNIDSIRINKILKLRYKGWGRFSKMLLTGLRVKDSNRNIVTIMDCLENTTMNFMQIINNKKLKFDKLIDSENSFDVELKKITNDLVCELQGSPAIKKGIWQTVQIVEELIHIMGHNPKNIFIEFARSDDDKKRTLSKVEKLQKIYTEIKNENSYNSDSNNAHEFLFKEDKKTKLYNERLYLYYIQQGKCMYSGKNLDISLLSSYQVDHIIPQSYIKDDSIENKVLVYSNENQYKGDKRLLSSDIVSKQYKWWEHLYKYKLIGEKKFSNLTRTSLSEIEEMRFINRQLVETRQITKHVANLFKNVYHDSNIVAIKAGLSHDFRTKLGLFKVREINDFHHAQDAYLASLIGTFVMKKYPSLKNEFIFTEYNQLRKFKSELKEMDKKRKGYGFIINQFGNEVITVEETGEVIWEGVKSVEAIRSVFNYKDCFITKKVEEKRGQLFNLTIKKKSSIQNKIDNTPHKVISINKNRADITQYGGFTDLENAYGIAIEYSSKKGVERIIANVPMFLADAKKDDLMAYLKAEIGSNDITIVKEKILFNQLMEIDGGLYFMASASEWNNAKQLILSSQSQKTLFSLFNDELPDPTDVDVMNVYDEYLNKLKQYYPLFTSIQEKFVTQRDAFLASSKKKFILKEMLKITKANPSFANLTKDSLAISTSAGRIKEKKIPLDKTTFYYQSITGLYLKKYKL